MSDENLKTVRGFNVIKREADEKILNEYLSNGEHEVIATILASRGVEPSSKSDFLQPKLKNLLPEIGILKDTNKAVARILTAIEKKESVCVFGDYDVDGLTSTAMLILFFKELGLDVEYYIPDRIDEGYGPNVKAMEKIAKNNTLLICVDCGVNAFEPLEKAKELGLDVVVFDHHKSAEKLPECVACVNPNRIDEESLPNDLHCLCACGVSFLFLMALNKELKNHGSDVDLMQFVPLVAFATICDVMNLTNLNRAFIKTGINVLEKGYDFNLKKLLVAVENDKNRNNAPRHKKTENLDIHTFGFLLGPMVNAGGRIGKSSLGVELMIEEDADNAQAIAERLYYLNEERKEVEGDAVQELSFQDDEIQKQIDEQGIIVLYSKDWHEGVIGLIASRIKEKYHYPVIAGTELSDGTIKFSARSVDGVDIGAIVLKAVEQGILLNGGGHKAAAGLTCETAKIKNFIDFLKEQVKVKADKSFTNKTIEYDVAISLNGLGITLVENILQLEPFGVGNSEPVFLLQDVIVNWTKVVNDRHVVLSIEDSSRNCSAICFNCLDNELGKFLLSAKNQVISLIATVGISEFKGQKRTNIKIKDAIAQN